MDQLDVTFELDLEQSPSHTLNRKASPDDKKKDLVLSNLKTCKITDQFMNQEIKQYEGVKTPSDMKHGNMQGYNSIDLQLERCEWLPCSPICANMYKEIPSLECRLCLCLFHLVCIGLPKNANISKFVCLNCELRTHNGQSQTSNSAEASQRNVEMAISGIKKASAMSMKNERDRLPKDLDSLSTIVFDGKVDTSIIWIPGESNLPPTDDKLEEETKT